MTYAKATKVSTDQSRTEIERTIKRYGGTGFAYFSGQNIASIVFEANDRRVRFDLPLPDDTDKFAQQRRQKWRALLLCIKAKMESVDSKIETFEEAFLAHVVMPDGMTVGQHAKPAIAQAYKDGGMVPLLPAPQKKDGK